MLCKKLKRKDRLERKAQVWGNQNQKYIKNASQKDTYLRKVQQDYKQLIKQKWAKASYFSYIL